MKDVASICIIDGVEKVQINYGNKSLGKKKPGGVSKGCGVVAESRAFWYAVQMAGERSPTELVREAAVEVICLLSPCPCGDSKSHRRQSTICVIY
jgi:hypothetical protein